MTPEVAKSRYPFLVETERFTEVVRLLGKNFFFKYYLEEDYEAFVQFIQADKRTEIRWNFRKWINPKDGFEPVYFFCETPEWFQGLIIETEKKHKLIERLRKEVKA